MYISIYIYTYGGSQNVGYHFVGIPAIRIEVLWGSWWGTLVLGKKTAPYSQQVASVPLQAATPNGVAPAASGVLKLHGWLSKLWPLFGYPNSSVPYYNRDPKRDHNFDHHPHVFPVLLLL